MRSSSATLIVALLTIVTLLALTGYQITGETSSVRMLGRLGASLIELDRWLPAHHDDIELLSRDRPNAPLELPNLPIEVAIPSSAVLGASDEALEDAITRAMGKKLRDDGASAIHDERGESHLEITEPVRWAIDVLGTEAHDFWRIALIVTGLALLVLCGAQFWMRELPFAGLAIGGAVASVFALAGWAIGSALSPSMDAAVDEEIALIFRDGAWIGVRNSLALTAIALALLYIFNSLGLLPKREEWDEWPDYEYDYEPEPERPAPPY